MIKINLLPRKPKRAVRTYDIYICALVTFINLLVIGGIYYVNNARMDHYTKMTGAAKKEIASLDPVYAEFVKLEKGKKEAEKRIRTIGGLKEGRALAARTLYDLTDAVKDNLWLKSFRKRQNRFELEGRSLENESISGFMESLMHIPYLSKVELRNVEDVTDEGIVVKKFIVHGDIGL